MKKFDVAIMNPPYDGSLHLKILEKVIPMADEVVNISPIRWLQDPLAKYKKNSDYNKFEETVSKHIENLKEVDSSQSIDLFDNTARFMLNLGIYKINTGEYKLYKTYDNSIVDKYYEYYKKHKMPLENNKKDGYRIYIPYVLATADNFLKDNKGPLGELIILKDGLLPNGDKWWKQKRLNQYSKTTDEIPRSISFDDEKCAENFIDSINTDFVKYIGLKIRTDMNNADMMPFMQDYSKPWTNERFCKYFNITGFISDTEAELGSEWEEILKTMEKYK